MSDALLEARDLGKCFSEGRLSVEVLKEVNFSIPAKQSVAITGASGSGKSTLLHLLGGLDLPSQGEVFINNRNISRMNEVERGALRNKYLASFTSFIIFCLNLPRSKTWPCPCSSAALTKGGHWPRPKHCWKRWVYQSALPTSPASFQAASGNGPRSPGHW